MVMIADNSAVSAAVISSETAPVLVSESEASTIDQFIVSPDTLALILESSSEFIVRLNPSETVRVVALDLGDLLIISGVVEKLGLDSLQLIAVEVSGITQILCVSDTLPTGTLDLTIVIDGADVIRIGFIESSSIVQITDKIIGTDATALQLAEGASSILFIDANIGVSDPLSVHLGPRLGGLIQKRGSDIIQIASVDLSRLLVGLSASSIESLGLLNVSFTTALFGGGENLGVGITSQAVILAGIFGSDQPAILLTDLGSVRPSVFGSDVISMATPDAGTILVSVVPPDTLSIFLRETSFLLIDQELEILGRETITLQSIGTEDIFTLVAPTDFLSQVLSESSVVFVATDGVESVTLVFGEGLDLETTLSVADALKTTLQESGLGVTIRLDSPDTIQATLKGVGYITVAGPPVTIEVFVTPPDALVMGVSDLAAVVVAIFASDSVGVASQDIGSLFVSRPLGDVGITKIILITGDRDIRVV